MQVPLVQRTRPEAPGATKTTTALYQPRMYNLMFAHDMEEVPRHALHEKGLQGQEGDVPLVGSQEQKALLVPLMKK